MWQKGAGFFLHFFLAASSQAAPITPCLVPVGMTLLS
jgi:hypothetical protein